LGSGETLAHAAWPVYDESKTKDATVEIAVQVNGKVKSVVAFPADADAAQVRETALADPKVAAAVAGMQIVKAIVIPGKIVNFVVKP
jgi:leucyl-tRNA synthetase